MRRARSPVLGLSLRALEPESQNRCWLLRRLKVLKLHCSYPLSPPHLDSLSPFFSLSTITIFASYMIGNHLTINRIDDRKSANPRMRGFLHGSGIIWQERGLRGFFQGFVPTTARQSANSATRFGSYITLKQFAQGYVAPGEKLGTVSTFGIGALAGLITV